MKEPPIRGKETLVIEEPIDRLELDRHPQHLGRQNRLPQRGLLVYRSQHDGLDPY